MNATLDLINPSPGDQLTSIKALDIVRLLRGAMTLDGVPIAPGSTGTVVHTWSDGAAFEVEFQTPVQAVVTIESKDLELQLAHP